MHRVWIKQHTRKGKTVKGHWKNMSDSKKGYSMHNNVQDNRFGVNMSAKDIKEFLDDPTKESIIAGTDSEGYSKAAYKDEKGIYIHVTRDEVLKHGIQNKVSVDNGQDFGKTFKLYIYKNRAS